ncbi:hypothetical protein MBLNU230_g3287t1 [Neophaeotheca triangularis]
MSSNGSQASASPIPTTQHYQDRLASYCRNNGGRQPTWQIVSDRRGARTAWSCTVVVGGQSVQARFWYDGQYVNSAREDAAERALEILGQIPSPNGPRPAHLQAQQQQQQQPPCYRQGTVTN